MLFLLAGIGTTCTPDSPTRPSNPAAPSKQPAPSTVSSPPKDGPIGQSDSSSFGELGAVPDHPRGKWNPEACAALPPVKRWYVTGEYRFSFNGAPSEPRIYFLHGEPGLPAPGDIVEVGGYLITLQLPGDYEFYELDSGPAVLVRRFADTTCEVIGARLKSSRRDFRRKPPPRTGVVWKRFADDLCEQLPSGSCPLMSVVLDDWDTAMAPALARVSGDETCVTVSIGAGFSKFDFEKAGLPTNLVALSVTSNHWPIKLSLRGLKAMFRLRFLALGLMILESVDTVTLSEMGSLRALELRGTEAVELEKLAKLRDLVYLDLSWARTMKSVEFAAALPELRYLDVSSTAVGDLSPLRDNPKLSHLVANDTVVTRLPNGGFSKLKSVSVMGCRLDEPSVASFEKAHPSTEIKWYYGVKLKKALIGITKIRIRTGGTCGTDDGSEKTIAELQTQEQITEFISKIAINEIAVGFHCHCCGEPTFEFYRGNLLAVSLGFHHGRSLRWNEGWPGDADLTEESASYLVYRLAELGSTDALKEWEEARTARDAREGAQRH